MWYAVVLTVLISYLLGNMNGAVIVSALMHDDVRSHGSGNAGLTNFIRNYGIGMAALVILIDVGKAVLACLIGGLLLGSYGLNLEGRVIGGLAMMIGHDFPALLSFKGGKGILSGWFVAFCVDWRVGLIVAVVFFAAYFLTMYVSLGSVLGAIAFGVGFAVFHHGNATVLICGLIMSALTVYMHRSNIVRLLKHQERKTNLFSTRKQ